MTRLQQTEFTKRELERRGWNGTLKEMYQRAIDVYASNEAHADILMKAADRAWWSPASPIFLSTYVKGALPISCFLNQPEDRMASINEVLAENMSLSANGGGVATGWANIRGIGAKIKGKGVTGGVLPYLRIQDSIAHGVSQGSIRAGSSAAYLPIWHSEIMEFINLRFADNRDERRRCYDLFPAVVIDNTFMAALAEGSDYEIGRDSGITKKIPAREIWQELMRARMLRGVPYIMFEGNLNPESNVLPVSMSNLCTEILLPTGVDQYGKRRTAICCLASVNDEYYDEWKFCPEFLPAVLEFLDNVIEAFIRDTENLPGYESARYSAQQQRSVGIGRMGTAYAFAKRNWPYDSQEAGELDVEIQAHIRKELDKANARLAFERGACPDSLYFKTKPKRNFHTTAIAPTSTISGFLDTSPCTEPVEMYYVASNQTGVRVEENKYAKKLIPEDIFREAARYNGNTAYLANYPQYARYAEVFKGPWQIDPKVLIDRAAARQPYLDQGQSLNLWRNATADMSAVTQYAWRAGVVTLYYQHNERAQQATSLDIDDSNLFDTASAACSIDNPNCEACQ